MLRESLAASRALGDEHGFAPTTEAMLSHALYMAGDLDAAEETASASKEHSAPADIINFIMADWVLALVRMERGDLDEAKALARTAVREAYVTDVPVCRAEADYALAIVLSAAGEREEAREAAGRALALYEQKGDETAAGPVRTLLAKLAHSE